MSEKLLTSFSFYPQLWLSDVELLRCSFEAQGVLIKLMCYMAQSSDGSLTISEKTQTEEEIRELLHLDKERFNKIWKELTIGGDKAIIKKRHHDGAFYSKRFTMELNKREKENSFNQQVQKAAEEIIGYFNSITGKKYTKYNKFALKCIKERMEEGFVISDFKAVVDIKYEEWHRDEKYAVNLRPETLFGDKFESYLNQNSGYLIGKRDKDKVQKRKYNTVNDYKRVI